MSKAGGFLSAVLVFFGFAQAAGEPISGCEARDGLEPVCGLHGSEDMEVLPHARQLLLSESRLQIDSDGMHWQPGGIGLLSLDSRTARRLYPTRQDGHGRRADWGDANCPGEIGARLSPHGIHLSQRSDGRWQLLVVNHGGRESVELFELVTHASGPGDDPAIALEWRGCAVAPAHSVLNDVAALPDGAFVVTMMMDDSESMLSQSQRAARGENTGYVLRWDAQRGFQQVPGSAAPMPNGIQTSADGTLMFVAANTTGEVRKYDLRGQLQATAKVPHPDNLSWSPDGSLLVAGLQSEANIDECFSNFFLPCGAAFNVFAIDPRTMKSRLLLAHEGAPMGMATVAVQAGDCLYVGSVAGDRILQAPLPGLQQRRPCR